MNKREKQNLASAIKRRDDALRANNPCGDGGCIVIRPIGQHTNGGCKCAREWVKMQRTIYIWRRFADDMLHLEEDQAVRA